MESFRIHRGVTLIEMIVVVAIVMVLTAIVVVGSGTFNKTIVLAATAYDVGLSMRTAESFGSGSRQAGAVQGNIGYGLHFDKNNTSSYQLFADSNPTTPEECHASWPSHISNAPDMPAGNCTFDESGDVSVGGPYVLGNGITITDLCVQSALSTPMCGLDKLDIVFSRPGGTVYLASDGVYDSTLVKASIKLSSPQGTSQYVCISTAGQIETKAASCL